MGKIVFVTPSLKTGGGNRVFIELANQLCEKYQVIIIYPNNSKEHHTFNLDARIEVISVGRLATKKIAKLLNILKLLNVLNRKYREDIQVITDPIFSVISFLLHGIRIFRFMQADDYRIYDDGMVLGKGLVLKTYKWACLKSYQTKVGFIFNSKFVYEQFCQDSGRTDVACRIVHPAINHTIFFGAHRCNTEKINICLVARKHPSKGLETFLQVYRSLPRMFLDRIGKVQLISHDDLSEFDTAGMEIIKPTADKDIVKVYTASDIFISTSWREGFGLPPLEAMACGCAVVTSNSGGVNEYIRPESNCLVFEPREQEQLQKQLCRLIEDNELRASIAMEGMKTASLFDWQRTAKQLKIIIDEQ